MSNWGHASSWFFICQRACSNLIPIYTFDKRRDRRAIIDSSRLRFLIIAKAECVTTRLCFKFWGYSFFTNKMFETIKQLSWRHNDGWKGVHVVKWRGHYSNEPKPKWYQEEQSQHDISFYFLEITKKSPRVVLLSSCPYVRCGIVYLRQPEKTVFCYKGATAVAVERFPSGV